VAIDAERFGLMPVIHRAMRERRCHGVMLSDEALYVNVGSQAALDQLHSAIADKS